MEGLLLKALAKDPDDRYPSAGDLAADIDRYLDGKPLAALPASTPYVLRKWVGRRRRALGLTAAAILVLGALGVFIGVLMSEQALARKAASNRLRESSRQADLFDAHQHLAAGMARCAKDTRGRPKAVSWPPSPCCSGRSPGLARELGLAEVYATIGAPWRPTPRCLPSRWLSNSTAESEQEVRVGRRRRK